MFVDSDFHLHGSFSMAVSSEMSIENLALGAKQKGLHLIGTGDCLHPQWFEQINELSEEKGLLVHPSGTRFALTTEIEDKDRVHHIIILPSKEAAKDLRTRLLAFPNNMDNDGRPKIRIGGEALANIVTDLDGLLGPAHAFTPWTSIYKSFRTLKGCYGESTDKVTFLELGLSADTFLADKISELQNITFLTNSDSHSPWPLRLGREFTRLEMKALTFDELSKSIKREEGRKPVLNVGFDPRHGKYHCTACSRCFQKYSIEEARINDFKCLKCAGRIKRGVKDLVEVLGDQPSHSPAHRPPYVHMVPLIEIIEKVKGRGVGTRAVKEAWQKLIDTFGSEIKIMLDMKTSEVESVDPDIAAALQKFRDGEIVMIPGGGGKYGELLIPKNREELKKILRERAPEINCVSGIAQQTLKKFI